MEFIDASTFLDWAAAQGIVPDQRYADPRCLVYSAQPSQSRFWTFPESIAAWPEFLQLLATPLSERSLN